MPADLIPNRLLSQAARNPQAPAYHVRTPSGWKSTTWADYAAEVRLVARALMSLGFGPKETVCILGFNRPEWAIADHAAMMAGGAPAGIYTTCSSDEVHYILHHSEAMVAFVEDEAQFRKIVDRRETLPRLRLVVLMRGAKFDDPLVSTWEDFLKRADGVPDADLDRRLATIQDADLGTLIYTSGTTGPPKAVMLSHRNLAWTSAQALEVVKPVAGDCSLSYLPLSHIAEQMFTLHLPATCGYEIYFAESMEKLADNLKEVQPSIVFGVPRVWEKLHAGIVAKSKESKGAKKRIGAWATALSRRVVGLKNAGKPIPLHLRVQHKLANRLVYSAVRPLLGLGRARFCVTGAAPIDAAILEFLAGFDVIIHEVYGQSEDTGPTTFNLPGKTRFGTAGPALQGVTVKIADDGEILVKGPNVFMGYYKDPAATADALSEDGWLRSGDLGQFDEDGFLHITGRKKEIIITAGGKNIAPKNIEAELKRSPLVAEAVVIGDRRKFLSALLVIDEDAAGKLLAGKGGDPKSHPDVLSEVQKAVDACNEKFARVEWVRKWKILPRPLSVEHGELTPTLKIKRRKVEEHFRAHLDEIYAEDATA